MDHQSGSYLLSLQQGIEVKVVQTHIKIALYLVDTSPTAFPFWGLSINGLETRGHVSTSAWTPFRYPSPYTHPECKSFFEPVGQLTSLLRPVYPQVFPIIGGETDLEEVSCKESSRAGQSHSGVKIHLLSLLWICIGSFAGLGYFAAYAYYLSYSYQLQLRYINIYNL